METGEELSGVKKIRLHALRYSHASLLISKPGVRPKLVSERLGHEKIQTTLDTYSHLYPDQLRNLADQLNCLVDESDEEGARATKAPAKDAPALVKEIDRLTDIVRVHFSKTSKETMSDKIRNPRNN